MLRTSLFAVLVTSGVLMLAAGHGMAQPLPRDAGERTAPATAAPEPLIETPPTPRARPQAPPRAQASVPPREQGRVRPQLRVQPRYPYRRYHSPYPLSYDYEYPGPNAVRQCVARYVPEHRPSGTVIVPRMRCWWAPG